MKNLSKLLIAASLAASFAAPVYAANAPTDALAQTLAERNAYTNPQPVSNGWTASYAMAPARSQMAAWKATASQSWDRNVSPASMNSGLEQQK